MSDNLSIIIPTKNREFYCLSTVRSILEYEGNFEVIVCDSSNEEQSLALNKKLIALDDCRLKYVQSDSAYNMTENFNFSIRQASKDYIVIIGDDDGVSPLIFSAVKQCQILGIDSMTSDFFYFEYNWPDYYSSKSGKVKSSTLYFDDQFSEEIVKCDVKKILNAMYNRAGQGCHDMPRAYHGLISKSLRDDLIQRYGNCFFGVSPDVSFSVLAATHSKLHYVARYPLTISGNGGKSNAGRSAAGTHKGDLKNDSHMKNYGNITWPRTVPSFFSVESVWAQATLEAIGLLQIEKRETQFSYSYLYALMLLKHFDMRAKVFESIQFYVSYMTFFRKLSFVLKLFLQIFNIGFVKSWNILKIKLMPDSRKSLNFDDIYSASAYLNNHYGRYYE